MMETTTQTNADTTVADLKVAVKDASKHERELAQELDSLPEKIRQQARQDARRAARAAREGGTGQAVQDAANESAVPAMRQRQQDLPFLRWSAAVRHNSLQVELHDAQIEAAEQRAREAQTGLPGLKATADEAARVFDEQYREYRGAVGAKDALTGRRAVFARELRLLEESMPGLA